MNKILVHGDLIEQVDSDNAIEVNISNKSDMFSVTKLKIKVLKDTNLNIYYENNENSKLDICIEVEENVNFNLFELREEEEIKVQYKYYLKANSYATINKFYDVNKVRELDIINLDGESANIEYNFKTISKDTQKYDMMIYHNYKNTISNVTNKGVNIKDGNIVFNVTGIVYNKINDCVINQNNRIINLNDKKCVINPNLLIEENDVEANHSALIGKFSDDELFYLMSRGINKEQALNLLIKGFLTENINEKDQIEKIINKYWR